MPARPHNSATVRLATQLLRRRRRIAEQPRLHAAIFILVLALLAGLSWPFVVTHLQAMAVLDLVADKSVPELLRPVVTGPVVTREVILPLADGPVRARLYVPRNHLNAPALLVLHGVHHLGIDEPRLVAFASAMAACGLRVLTPELPDIKDYHVGSNSIATIGESAVWLAQHNGGHPVGVFGLSFSGSLALLAAAEPEFSPSMKFVVAVGSEDEMVRVADYYRTGVERRPDGTIEQLPPHEYGTLVMEYENLQDFVPNPADIEPLRAVLRAHLYEDVTAEDAALARLTPAQRAQAKQLMDTTSSNTHRLLSQSNARHLQAMAAISPHGHLAALTVPVYLLAGEGDNIIPSAETQWLETELPRKKLAAVLISPVISHLDLDGAGPTLLDQLHLVQFFALILHAAEAH
jgi:pimeloyl-ACP methyl ester carboxylesterase